MTLLFGVCNKLKRKKYHAYKRTYCFPIQKTSTGARNFDLHDRRFVDEILTRKMERKYKFVEKLSRKSSEIYRLNRRYIVYENMDS